MSVLLSSPVRSGLVSSAHCSAKSIASISTVTDVKLSYF